MTKKLKTIFTGILAFAMILSCAGMVRAEVTSSAPHYIQVNTWHKDEDGTLQAFPDIQVQLHRVADVAVGEPLSFTYTLTPDFAGSKVDVSAGADADAAKLYEYAVNPANGLKALRTGVTADNGSSEANVLFDELDEGLYLVSQVPTTGDKFLRYAFDPFLISLPMADSESGGGVCYGITANPKCEEVNNPIDVVVKKAWKGVSEASRPGSVEIQLSGTKGADTRLLPNVVLNADNNWTYTWHNLSEDYTWKVTEVHVPDGYEVSYSAPSREDPADTDPVITFVVTNEKHEAPPLIQTGQLNWPIPILAVCGVALVIAGCVIGRHGKKEEQ